MMSGRWREPDFTDMVQSLAEMVIWWLLSDLGKNMVCTGHLSPPQQLLELVLEALPPSRVVSNHEPVMFPTVQP